MPYAKPPSSPEETHDDLPPLKLRPKHRRTRSAYPVFSDERGPGAFTSLPNLPRRKSHSGERRAVFHFDEQDSDSSEEHTVSDSFNALRLTVDTRAVPPNVPKQDIDSDDEQVGEETSCLPFPTRGSPVTSPVQSSPSMPDTTSPLPRTPSTPIILSNGKPLKPSLKSSASSPLVPSLRLTRAQSEPATPSCAHKNVHFAGEEKLRSVRVFNSSGKPVNVSRTGPAAEETETETECDNQDSNAFPFPTIATSQAEELPFEIDSAKSTPIPSTRPCAYSNVHLETISFPRSGPPVLRGSVLVRNLAFVKDVAVRFTFDDWQTTSEVGCKHVVSLPTLPPPFPIPTTAGDRAAANVFANTWDRFSFQVRLEDLERRLHEKTMWIAVRYTAPGFGEWWDNNESQNYVVEFRKKRVNAASDKQLSTLVSDVSPMSPIIGHSQQRTFSAPPTLKGTPTTEALQTAQTTMAKRDSMFPSRSHRTGQLPRSLPFVRHNSSPNPLAHTSIERSASAKPLYSSVPTKLNLFNYSAPAQSLTTRQPLVVRKRDDAQESGKQKISKDSSSSSSSLESSSSSTVKGMGLVAGMPATAPRYDSSWPPSSNSSSQSLGESTPPPLYTALPPRSETERLYSKSSASLSLPVGNESSYIAFIKQWCFAQSSPSANGLLDGSSSGNHSTGNEDSWRGLSFESFNGFCGSATRNDSTMLAST